MSFNGFVELFITSPLLDKCWVFRFHQELSCEVSLLHLHPRPPTFSWSMQGLSKGVHIGQSGCNSKVRVKEHRRAVESGNTDASTVAEHALKSDHRVIWEAVEIVDASTEFYRRCMIESWHIQSKNETVSMQGPRNIATNI